MFFFTIYQSSYLEFYNLDKKLVTTFFWGTICYLLLHAILGSTNHPFLMNLKKTYWLLLIVDLGVCYYLHYHLNNNYAEKDEQIVSQLLQNISKNKNSNNNNNNNKNNDNIDNKDNKDNIDNKNEKNRPDDKISQNQLNTFEGANLTDETDSLDSFELDNDDNDDYQQLGSFNTEDNVNTNMNTNINPNKMSTSLADLNGDDSDSGSDLDLENFDKMLN